MSSPPALLLFAALLACPSEDEVADTSGHLGGVDLSRDYRLVEAFPAQAPFVQPLFLAQHPSDPDVSYVVTQPGVIYRVPRDGSRADRHVYLDLSGRVLTENWEEGLLGFAFDPDHAENGHVFVYYSERTDDAGQGGLRRRRGPGRQSVIARFTAVEEHDGPVVDEGSELRILTIEEPFGNHNGGTVVFGPDRMLYIAVGDGGAANDPYGNGQNLGTLLGAILRIDVSKASREEPYRIPADNPFADAGELPEGGRPRGEIWAYGLRNPWRIAFDRKTGDLWCGDVGQNLYEEVDRIEKGRNYGWNLMEGFHSFRERAEGDAPADTLAPPIAEYPRAAGISVTGGYVYRGRLLPGLDGRYLYGDFGTRRQWAVMEDRAGGKHSIVRLPDAPAPIASYAEDENGEIFVLCYHGDSGREGRIHRLVAR